MPEHPRELLDAGRTIGQFAEEFGIEFQRFERLRDRDPRFAGLNARRLREWALTSLKRPPQHKANAQTQAWLLELARMIREEQDQLLAWFDVPRTPLQPGASRTSAPGPLENPAGEFKTPEQLCDFAIAHASCGYHAGALASLTAAIRRSIPSDFNRVALLLPTTIYILNRYFTPHELASTIQDIHVQLEPYQLKHRIEPQLLHVTLAQLACAFTDRRSPEPAEELFFSPEVRQLMEPNGGPAWLTPQLLRTCSMYWGVFGHRGDTALKYAAQANEAGGDDVANDSRIANVLFTIYLSMNPPQSKKAWEVIEPHYEQSRQILINAANCNEFSLNGLILLHGNVYCGTVSRFLSGKGYARGSDLADDINALEWVEGIYGRVAVANESIQFASNRFSPEFSRLHHRSFRTGLTPWQTSILWDFQKLLTDGRGRR